MREEEVTEAVGHQPNGDHLQDVIARVWALFCVPMNKIHFSKVSQSTGDICSHLRQFCRGDIDGLKKRKYQQTIVSTKSMNKLDDSPFTLNT